MSHPIRISFLFGLTAALSISTTSLVAHADEPEQDPNLSERGPTIDASPVAPSPPVSPSPVALPPIAARRSSAPVVTIDAGGSPDPVVIVLRDRRAAVRENEVEREPAGNRKDLWIPGVTLLVTSYVAASHMSIGGLAVHAGWCFEGECRNDGFAWGLLPLAGPIIIAADDHFETGWRVAYGILGGVQQLGLALTIAGAVTEKKASSHTHDPMALAVPNVAVGPGSVRLDWRF